MHANLLLFVDDVTSISWINALFACFIALIEIGRYITRHGEWLVKKGESEASLGSEHHSLLAYSQ